ncbi:HTH domain-containing protein [Clostridium sporogenes]|uniref:HTH domain-containing protein n=1 Tax=Clostridium sporogenes TaxID=1509 RepID=UPI003D2F1462
MLSRNKNVKTVSSKQITYQDLFKELFITKHSTGKLPRDIFIENGFTSRMLGQSRIDYCSVRCHSEGVRDIEK